MNNVNHEIYEDGIGRVSVSSVKLPNHVKIESGTYTFSGKVLITYKTENDMNTKDFYNLAILNDDGTDFQKIFSGVIPMKAKANGIRFMPFQDNTRVLLGDYVLECSPDIDHCKRAKLVPIEYPSELVEDEQTTHHWSEIIIAPDNKHMSWTMLRSDVGAAVAIGILERKTDYYTIKDVKLISTINYFKNDPDRPGYIIPNTIRGGEVKQFVHGGNAISVVGGKKNSTPDSVVMDLTSKDITQITHTPGYDETTIFSPDERLGIVMSTRFSKNTDPAIFGLIPRPYAIHTTMGIPWFLYTYAVTGVRKFRKGNIGPVLIDIERSMNESEYQGIQLTTDENWVYLSPMSWHPDGKWVMWPEMIRGGSQIRLQKADLIDYKPGPTIPAETTTDHIPYAINDFNALKSAKKNVTGKVAGKHSGYINYVRYTTGQSGRTEAEYVNFSNDGENFYDGYEKLIYNMVKESCYEVDLQLTGSKEGETKFRATFSSLGGDQPAKLLFDTDVDGKPKSFGYASFNGRTLHIDQLLE